MNTLFLINSMIDDKKSVNEIILALLKLTTDYYKNFQPVYILYNPDKSLSIITPGKPEKRIKKDDIVPEITDFLKKVADKKQIYSERISASDVENFTTIFRINVQSLLIKQVKTFKNNTGFLLFISSVQYKWLPNEIEFMNQTGETIKNVFNLLNIQTIDEALQSAEKQYKTLYNTMRRGVVFQDVNGKIFDANPAAEKILGLSAGELNGMPLTDSMWNTRNISGDVIKQEGHLCTRVLNTQNEIRDEIISIQNQSTGKIKLLSISAFPEFNLNTGKLIRLFTVFDDITQQRQLIEELKTSEDKYRKLVDYSMVGIYQTTLTGEILYVNRAAARMLEYDSQIDLTKSGTLFRYENNADREKLLKEYKKRQGKIERYELSLKTFKNKTINVIISGMIKDETITGMMVDITEMKKAAAELKLNEERLESLLKMNEYKESSDEEISGFALDEAVKLTGSKFGYLHFINEDQKTISLNTWSTETLKSCHADKDTHYPIEKAGIWVECFHKRVPVVHNDYQNYNGKKGYPEGHIHLERHLSVPVFDGNNIVAIAGVGNKSDAYIDNDVRQLTLFMNSMWGILKRNRAEKALMESEKIYRSFVQNFQGIAFRLNLDWSPVFFHGSVEKLTGYTEHELLALKPDWKEIVHPEDFNSIFGKYPSEISLNPDFTVERTYRIIRKDGKVRWVHDVIHTQVTEDGKPLFINGAILDVTASKQTQDEFETLFNLSSDLICIASLDGYFLKINPAFNQLLGYPDEELKSRPFVDFTVDEDKQKTLDVINDELRMGKTVINFQNRYRCKDGHVVWLDWNSRPIPELNMMFAVARDISLQKQSEEELYRMMQELERSNRDLEEFAYVASHDLQEPLRKIKSFTNLFASKFKGQIDETADKYVNYIVDGASRMQNLINDLLALSRITTKGKAFSLTDIGDCINHAVENLDMLAKDNNASIHFEKMPAIIADNTQMVQLFQNLISNAIKFRKKDIEPEIFIEVKEKPEYWLFKVRDNGIGMDMKFADRIFVAFQRLHTRDEYPGTGIGLAICKKIVERHGGKIEVKSSPGQGSTFKFKLQKK